MPLGPGSEHLSERLHRMFEREVERRQERSAQLPHERATVLTRAVEVEAALSEPDVSREERKRLRAELQELRQDADDLKREQERLSDDIENARRQWRAAVAVEGAEALTRLTAEMDRLVDTMLDLPKTTWREHLDAARLVSALAQRWLNAMGETTYTTKIVDGFPLYARVPMWDRPSRATVGDLIIWVDKSARAQARLAEQETP
jgi:predicted RNase H-like nuclease (RuvC/YqgF family)